MDDLETQTPTPNRRKRMNLLTAMMLGAIGNFDRPHSRRAYSTPKTPAQIAAKKLRKKKRKAAKASRKRNRR